ncbi:MAG: hypothetical protein R6V46_16895 [Desulfatiglandaceae bacterium]|jgi:hypothetical protein
MPSQAGDLASGFIFMNHALGSGLLKNGDGVGEAFLGLLQGVAGHDIFDLFQNVLGPGFVVFVSDAPHFALASTLER